MMLNIRRQSGFTLVELAIVLVIVGLLIGGILKGQKLLLNSKVTATVAQIKGIEAAVTNFRDVYGALPGDLKNSTIKIPGCSGEAYCATNGDGSIGESDWNMEDYQYDGATNCNTAGDACTGDNEPLLFWYSLQQAGLIAGVTDEIITPTGANPVATGINNAFGKTIPAAKVGGGFWAGNSSNGYFGTAVGDPTSKYTLFGSVITLVKSPYAALTNTAMSNVSTPAVIANIDRKLDDGMPKTGSVQAYGFPTSCYGGVLATSNSYAESVTNLDCGVHIRIQK